MSHKFKLGQRVRQSRGGFGSVKDDASGLLCEIVRLMPEDRTGEPGYRIKSSAGERAATESELSLAG
ncbi:hypothetical protein AFCDBAGC_0559 [Methylobacterium cerastii]|uniref:Hypervirulence associated protein TUDOR domain-containing protein n=1 Tax=Methylobacterium cerastii TaxID=932741 RepID=A0ABQ4QBX3_9HYPH|nr:MULTISPECIES: hypothetical protein [Methylobacterium]TXM81386.1 hypothetical protein FV219_27835 [Methylobacterium sp. WL122]TXM68654.1 hypothetical protein FV229_07255 [Methylobacterium sp. WL120]TXM76801.1 hypothetical protein FV226_00885 [Methylobacterium sp. WL12]TXN07105.1 hypothetical protein FV222_03320 [Methylobacterium sp. WL103]TXN80670.1 hypothetical protein FV234_16175 [Methylobacterium sp. WL8]